MEDTQYRNMGFIDVVEDVVGTEPAKADGRPNLRAFGVCEGPLQDMLKIIDEISHILVRRARTIVNSAK